MNLESYTLMNPIRLSNSILKNKVELVWINSSYTLDSITLKLIIFLIWIELG